MPEALGCHPMHYTQRNPSTEAPWLILFVCACGRGRKTKHPLAGSDCASTLIPGASLKLVSVGSTRLGRTEGSLEI